MSRCATVLYCVRNLVVQVFTGSDVVVQALGDEEVGLGTGLLWTVALEDILVGPVEGTVGQLQALSCNDDRAVVI